MGFLFSSSKSSTPVTKMPVQSEQDRAAAAEARRRTMSRTGRSSTIMTQRRGEAGTQAYGNSLLGQAG